MAPPSNDDRKKRLVFGALVAGNTITLAACGGGGTATPFTPGQTPAPSPSPSASAGTQASVTVPLGASPSSTTVPEVAGIKAGITLPGIPNAPANASANITLSTTPILSVQPLARRIVGKKAQGSSGPTGWYFTITQSMSPPEGWQPQFVFYLDPNAWYYGSDYKYWYLEPYISNGWDCTLFGPGTINGTQLTFNGVGTPAILPDPDPAHAGWTTIAYALIVTNVPFTTSPFWCPSPSPSPTPTPVGATPSPTPGVTPTPVPTHTPTVTPSPSPTPTATPVSANYSSVSAMDFDTASAYNGAAPFAQLHVNQADGVEVYQTVNGADYTGPYTVNLNTCAPYATVSNVVMESSNRIIQINQNSHMVGFFTVYAGNAPATCSITITGGGNVTLPISRVRIH